MVHSIIKMATSTTTGGATRGTMIRDTLMMIGLIEGVFRETNRLMIIGMIEINSKTTISKTSLRIRIEMITKTIIRENNKTNQSTFNLTRPKMRQKSLMARTETMTLKETSKSLTLDQK